VELPADLPAATFERLADTRISGMLIDLRPDRGAGPGVGNRRGRPTGPRPDGPRAPRPADSRPRKPRHKKGEH
jgi:ATP-dependent RNA helicase DeaD